MSLPDRRENEVRRLLAHRPGHPVPADLAERAGLLGTRLLRRRRALLAAAWLVLGAAAVALAAWALATEPWSVPPPATSPTGGW
ncbi:hypothetical protein [Streptomyces sp. NRRL F-5053]|uniref:hypothetical protein n=1 Tax=Streptomyces sp. NRRL F-5053 TaxID=1463854 RepID=UPI0004C98F7F|nr:hypothetical protein [Streptomyces sp. NRRL F-5053]